jgi:hypothetical protein
VDEETQNEVGLPVRLDEQILVDNNEVSYSSLEVKIIDTNTTLREYYEGIRPPDYLA